MLTSPSLTILTRSRSLRLTLFPHYPSNYTVPNIIGVASTDSSENLSGFSNFGGRIVTMGAPGSSILSTIPPSMAQSLGLPAGTAYATFSGTSMATPHVSGAAALVLALNSNISIQNLRGVLAFSGDVLPSLQGRTTTGRRLNVAAALNSATEAGGAADVTAPANPSNLQATSVNGRNVTLQWSAPGDDASSGMAADYDFTFLQFGGGRLILPTTLAPAAGGTMQSLTVTVPYLNQNGTIELRAYDNAGNFGASNVSVFLGQNELNDPYITATNTGPEALSTGGTSLNLIADDRYIADLPLPFAFPFYGEARTTVTISTNGALYFSTPPKRANGDAGDVPSSVAALQGQTMIAGLWDDLRTDRANGGVFVVQPDSTRIIYRWEAVTFDRGEVPVNFEIELRSSGQIIFRYGAGQSAPTNTNLFSVVGISAGEPDAYIISSHTAGTIPLALTNANVVTFTPRGGLPTPSPTPSPSPTPTPSPAPGGVRQIALATNDLIYNPINQRIYASLPSSAGSIGNSITQIDPFTATVGSSVFIGSEPGKLAISESFQYIYASLDGAAAVRRFDLTSQTAGLQFSLGSDSFFGPYYVEDMAAIPGSPDSVAISRKNLGVSPRHAGVAVYDNGNQRPTATARHTGSNVIESSSSASTLYGYNNETSEFGFRKMSVNASGLSVTSTVSNVISGYGVDIKYDNGLIYTTTGRVLNPETGTLIGLFADAFGLVVPDAVAGRVYFLTGLGSSTLILKAYNLNTFTQTGALSITGVSGNPGSFIKWGANGLAFRTQSQVFFISTSAIIPIPQTALPAPVQVADGVIRLPLLANDLVYDPNTQKVYASIPSTAGSFGNSLAPINPLTGNMSTPIFIGSEPRKLAISSNNQYIYAGLDGVAAARRFDIASQSAQLQFALGNLQFTGALYAEDMAVLPGNPNSIAISRRNVGFSPRHEGVAIYDDGVVRPVVTPGHTGSNVIEFSSTASTLYGYNNETTEFGFRKMAVITSGLSVATTVSNVISGFGVDIKYDNGAVYASTGRVINPETGTILGTFSGVSSPAFVPDSTVGRVYFVTGSGGSTTLQAFDQNTFLPVGSLGIPGVSGTPSSLIRWGSNGLAFRTSSNQVFFIQTSLVPAASGVQLSASSYNVGEGAGQVEVIVNRSDTSGAVSVDYATSDSLTIDKACQDILGVASSRCDYVTSIGTLRFAAGEGSKTIFIPVVDDSYAEGNETFTITLSKPTGTTLGSITAATISIQDNETVNGANPIDRVDFFIRQQYLDFLGREPDPAGKDFWTDNITLCSNPARRPPGQTEAQCTLRQRETTSGAFFLSPEFQYTGYYVYRMYQGALGRQPMLSEFTPDAQFVGAGILVNSQLSGAKINQNKADFAQQFVNCTDAAKSRCAEFKAIYDGLNNQQYVDKLFQTTGVNASASDRAALVNGMNANPSTETRASVLQKVVDGIVVIAEGNQQFTTSYGQAFYNSEFNRAFVQMEYFGYLKRDPDAAGYAHWLGKLNQYGGNFVNAEMVLAFISSPEYRARFGQP